MILLMRRVSLRKCFNFPKCFIQGFWSEDSAFSFSSTASMTNCRSGTPRAAGAGLGAPKDGVGKAGAGPPAPQKPGYGPALR